MKFVLHQEAFDVRPTASILRSLTRQRPFVFVSLVWFVLFCFVIMIKNFSEKKLLCWRGGGGGGLNNWEGLSPAAQINDLFIHIHIFIYFCLYYRPFSAVKKTYQVLSRISVSLLINSSFQFLCYNTTLLQTASY